MTDRLSELKSATGKTAHELMEALDFEDDDDFVDNMIHTFEDVAHQFTLSDAAAPLFCWMLKRDLKIENSVTWKDGLLRLGWFTNSHGEIPQEFASEYETAMKLYLSLIHI